MQSNLDLVEFIRNFYFATISPGRERVIDAMREVDRVEFLPAPVKGQAWIDEPVVIGYGQTCSQPSLVAFMLDELAIFPGCRVLEIGSGCGYAAALASRLCGESGRIFACEIIPGLASLMRANFGDRYPNIEIIEGDGSAGFPLLAPFDRIILSAGVDASRFDRNILLAQLANPGILMYPEAQGRLYKLKKTGQAIEEKTFGYVSFVPLRGCNA
jgi:protein-L-isoaspartate(D-aspartate) O-methyltransferase